MSEQKPKKPAARPDPARRRFLKGLGAGSGILLAPGILYGRRGDSHFEPATSLFTLGIASGDPGPTSVILWTRLAPDPLNGGGMGDRRVTVEWEVALDPGMAHIVRRGRGERAR